ncbi:hypothetical protein [Peteryoungia ipomoeae]|uniref:Uncharacterized protein n=1 Tax=Peteryoungia ipomoeae TaxID=1210932 RepID=A0A4S8P2I2_9HYPH|nr:hypothetical protein [Peteryoungia ipomoeae]THV22902.1 hypothetical protein FAA97_09645 [Peteryoungia ipomoeae]
MLLDMGTLQKIIKIESIWSLWNMVRDNWAQASIFFLGGGGLSYLAAATDWLNAWGPIAWGVAFFFGAFLALGIRYTWLAINSRHFINRQVEISVANDGVNPRESRFERRKIPLANFFSPYYFAHIRKNFIDCDMYGPVMLHMNGGTLNGVEFRHCQIVIVREGVTLWGVTALESPTVIGGTMANVTLLMTRGQYFNMPQDMRDNVPIIHEWN